MQDLGYSGGNPAERYYSESLNENNYPELNANFEEEVSDSAYSASENEVYQTPDLTNEQSSYETSFEVNSPVEDEAYKTDDYMETQLSKTKDRIMRLKELSMKLRTSNGLHEIESEPAYKRKNMNLDQVAHSSESQVSRFTLSVDEGVTQIKPNNSFLHDNVD